jgi:hypothetical protein
VTSEHRHAQRRRVLKGAAIWFAGRMSTMDCVVRDLSDEGCRLKTDGAAWAPDRFELSLGQGAIIERCEVVWRRQGEIGVHFLRDEPGSAPA